MSKPTNAMELVDRYLQAVRFWMPKTRKREDLLAELGEDLRLVIAGPLGEVILEDQHFLADIPLDRQIAMWDRIGDVAQCCEQRAFIGWQIGRERRRADIHVT